MEDSICKNFAKKLKEIREKQGLSKGQLSSLADCDISYIGKIERSEKYPNLKMIAKLAVALGVSAKDLFACGLGNIIAEIDASKLSELTESAKVIGEVTADATFVYGDVVITMGEALNAWTGTLEKVFPTKGTDDMSDVEKGLKKKVRVDIEYLASMYDMLNDITTDEELIIYVNAGNYDAMVQKEMQIHRELW